MNLKETLEAQKKTLETKLKLLEKFPNLQEVKGRWTTVLASPDVNEIIDKVSFDKSCGCCHDAVMFAKPYIEENGIKIHSLPVEFSICDTFDWEFNEEYSSWKDKMRESNISQKCIELTEEYLKKEKEEYLKKEKEDES